MQGMHHVNDDLSPRRADGVADEPGDHSRRVDRAGFDNGHDDGREQVPFLVSSCGMVDLPNFVRQETCVSSGPFTEAKSMEIGSAEDRREKNAQ